MKIIRYHNYSSPLFTPASDFTGLRDEMDRLFDAAFPALSSLQREGFRGYGPEEFPIDLFRAKNAFVVRAELPGFRKEDLNVEVTDGILTVTGHQKTETTDQAESKEKVGNVATQERRVSRSITLPEQLEVEQIEAAYENGVLTVTLPQKEASKPRQITIDVK